MGREVAGQEPGRTRAAKTTATSRAIAGQEPARDDDSDHGAATSPGRATSARPAGTVLMCGATGRAARRTTTTTPSSRDQDDGVARPRRGRRPATRRSRQRVAARDEEARDDAIVNTVRDGGAARRSTTSRRTTSPRAFDRLKTENAALRHEARPVPEGGGRPRGRRRRRGDDGPVFSRTATLPGRALDVVVEDQGAGPATRTLAEVPMIGAAAPVCACLPSGPWAAAAPALCVGRAPSRPSARPSKIELQRTQSLDCVSRAGRREPGQRAGRLRDDLENLRPQRCGLPHAHTK